MNTQATTTATRTTSAGISIDTIIYYITINTYTVYNIMYYYYMSDIII